MGRSRVVSQEEAEMYPHGACSWYGKKSGWCERPAVEAKITKPIHEWSAKVPQPRWLCVVHTKKFKEVDPWTGRLKKKDTRVRRVGVSSLVAS